MAKTKTKWICQECGYETGKYLGKCPECSSWGSIVEEIQNCDFSVDDSIKPVSLNINSIELYELKQQDGTFVGSCYVVKQENMYFGYIVGRKHIFSFSKNYFLMKKTSELWVPFKTDEEMIYSLICKYRGDEQNIIAVCLVQTDKSSFENQTVLRSFSSDTDFFDALNEAHKILEKN